MAQLKGKVNYFGKTNVNNLYKNQQITNCLGGVLCLLERPVTVSCTPKVATAGLLTLCKAVREDKKLRLRSASLLSSLGI